MRRISLLIVLFLLCLPLGMSAETLRGDVNGNGRVDIGDVTRLIDYLLSGNSASMNLDNADVKKDGIISIADVTCLIDYLLSGTWPSNTQTFTVNGVSFTMVDVEGGIFLMGATYEQGLNDPWEDEYPVHMVTLSNYSIGQTEVTQELWDAVMSVNLPELCGNSYYTSANGYDDNPQRPAETVDYNLAQRFIRQLNLLTGQQFHLPTEAQWEFAARGGNLSCRYKFSGSDNPDEVAWYMNTVPEECPQPVGTKKPNELGLYDMSGNVSEMCYDAYADYSYEPQTDPSIPYNSDHNYHVIRGGHFKYPSQYIRVSSRVRLVSFFPIVHTTGIRLAL